jgi:hypothetical protein
LTKYSDKDMLDEQRNSEITEKIGNREEEEEEEEYEEEFEIEITSHKGSSIKVESSSYNKLDELLEKAFNTYRRLAKEESGEAEEKLQYQ